MSTPPPEPLDAAEDDPDAEEAADLPGYGASGPSEAQAPVGPPAQDR